MHPPDTPPEHAPTGAHAERPRFWWLRRFLIVVVIGILAIEAILVWPTLSNYWKNVGEIRWGWVAASIVAAFVSMDSFAQIQRTLLAAAGVKVRQLKSTAVYLAANSLSVTLPGGPVLSSTFIYRQSRRWGATPVIASWQLVMSGVLQGIGLALLGLGGALLAGAKTSPFSVIFTLGGFLAFLVLAQYIAGRPEALQGVGATVLGWINGIRKKEPDHGVARWEEILAQLEAVQLSRRDGGKAFGWSLLNWIADVGCLAFACYAAGGYPSIAGLAVAYAASKAAGAAIPIFPGGLGVVEIVLVPALVSSGMTGPGALSAVIIYRLVSFLLVAIVGWIIFFILFRSLRNIDPDVDPGVDIEAESPESSSS
ncbi:MAG: lysylphosphatidylglycerol synthase transmembrane domain-containing protein [Mycobacteriaceae bacterium]